MKSWVISVTVLVAVRSIPAFSSFQRAQRNADRIRFDLNAPFRIIEAACFAVPVGTFITPILLGTWRSNWWEMLISICFVLLVGRFLPGSILVTSKGIVEKRLLNTKRIDWDGVESVIKNQRKREILVTGIDGTEIIHSSMHVSPMEFMETINQAQVVVATET